MGEAVAVGEAGAVGGAGAVAKRASAAPHMLLRNTAPGGNNSRDAISNYLCLHIKYSCYPTLRSSGKRGVLVEVAPPSQQRAKPKASTMAGCSAKTASAALALK